MPIINTFHAYIYGTAFWYALRGAARIYDPLMVIGWFRPPHESHLTPNDLEIYTTRTDAFGLITIALMLLIFADAIPNSLSPATTLGSEASGLSGGKVRASRAPYAKLAIWATVFHHVTTGWFAFQMWRHPETWTVAMSVGVYGCAGLAILGAVAATVGLSGQGDAAGMPQVAQRGGGLKRN